MMAQDDVIFDVLRILLNVFVLLCKHISAERKKKCDGNVKTLLPNKKLTLMDRNVRQDVWGKNYSSCAGRMQQEQ